MTNVSKILTPKSMKMRIEEKEDPWDIKYMV